MSGFHNERACVRRRYSVGWHCVCARLVLVAARASARKHRLGLRTVVLQVRAPSRAALRANHRLAYSYCICPNARTLMKRSEIVLCSIPCQKPTLVTLCLWPNPTWRQLQDQSAAGGIWLGQSMQMAHARLANPRGPHGGTLDAVNPSCKRQLPFSILAFVCLPLFLASQPLSGFDRRTSSLFPDASASFPRCLLRLFPQASLYLCVYIRNSQQTPPSAHAQRSSWPHF